jgi:hypothetical protein
VRVTVVTNCNREKEFNINTSFLKGQEENYLREKYYIYGRKKARIERAMCGVSGFRGMDGGQR